MSIYAPPATLTTIACIEGAAVSGTIVFATSYTHIYVFSPAVVYHYRTGSGAVAAVDTDPVIPKGVGRFIRFPSGHNLLSVKSLAGEGAGSVYLYPVTLAEDTGGSESSPSDAAVIAAINAVKAAVDLATVAVNNVEAAVDLATVAVNNVEAAVDLTTVAVNNVEAAVDLTTVAVNNVEAAVDLTTVAVNNVETAVDLTTVAVNNVETAVDLTTVAVNNVETAVDLTTVAVNLTTDAVDLTTTAVNAATAAVVLNTVAVVAPYDAGTGADKSYVVNPLNGDFVNGFINVDSTNISGTNYYPSATGISMDGYKSFSFTGKMIEADALDNIVTVEVTNDEDTAAGDWVPIYFFDNVSNTWVANYTCNAATVLMAASLDSLNFRYIRLKFTGQATNTIILKVRVVPL